MCHERNFLTLNNIKWFDMLLKSIIQSFQKKLMYIINQFKNNLNKSKIIFIFIEQYINQFSTQSLQLHHFISPKSFYSS